MTNLQTTPLPRFSETSLRRIDGACDAAFCATMIARAEPRFRPAGLAYPGSYRDNDRAVIDDAELAAQLFTRLRRHLPHELHDASGRRWRLVGLNPRFRFCRYRNGQQFHLHRDRAHHHGPTRRSWLTLMIYLSDADHRGGATRYYRTRSGPLWRVEIPRRGDALVFSHALWHDGEPVHGGTKYVMRSDVMYEADDAPSHHHLGYIWQLMAAGPHLLSSGRDRTIRRWRTQSQELVADGVWRGHRSSIHALAQTPDGVVWSGARDGTLSAWRLGSDTPIASLHTQGGAVLSLAAFAGHLVSGSADGKLRFWRDGSLRHTIDAHDDFIWSLATTAGTLWSASEDGRIAAWSTAGDAVTAQRFDAPVRAITTAGGHVVAGLADGRVILDRTTHHLHRGAVRALVAIDGGFASAGEDDKAIVHRNGRALSRHPHGDFVTSLAIFDDALWSAGYDGRIRRLSLCKWH